MYVCMYFETDKFTGEVILGPDMLTQTKTPTPSLPKLHPVLPVALFHARGGLSFWGVASLTPPLRLPTYAILEEYTGRVQVQITLEPHPLCYRAKI